MAGRFKLLTDEHWSKAHVSAARNAGWEVLRVVNVEGLGRTTEDPLILAYCAEHVCVWVTSDEAAMGHVGEWLKTGRTLPGIIIASQRHRRLITPGRFLRFLEQLAAEQTPFAGTIRYLTPAE